MNYRHNYHAGNFADVVKHLVLVQLIKALQKKDKPFCYIDTHAGIGLYDLQLAHAQQTQEYKNGIALLYQKNKAALPALLQEYLDVIQHHNVRFHEQSLRYYPGSPLVALSLLRPEDRAVLNELHPEDAHSLRQQLKYCKQAHVHSRDAYEFLPALLPPAENRGLILIDPPFEKRTEFDDIIAALQKALTKFAQGVYLIWFPIKQASLEDFYQQLANLPAKNCLLLEFSIADPQRSIPAGLKACGLAIINPPWQVAEELEQVLPTLHDLLAATEAARYRLTILKS